MTDNNKGVKHPRQLAINETSSRRQIDQLDLFETETEDEEHPIITEFKKSLYTMSEAEAIIYDALCLACTEFYNRKWQDTKTGQWHDIIGRQDDVTESHYRFFAPENIIELVTVGPYKNEWPNVRNQMMKLALNPELKKKLIIDEKHYIIDVAIRITPWYETDNIEKFINLSPRRNGKGKKEAGKKAREATGKRETGKAKGRIIGWSIEFFKPLFEALLAANKHKSTGKKYFLTPPYYQLKLNATHKNILSSIDLYLQHPETPIMDNFINQMELSPQDKEQRRVAAKQELINYFTNLRYRFETVTPLQARNFYMGLSLKNNHKGDYITIDNLVEFVDGIWSELIRTDRYGNRVLQPKEYKQVLERIDLILKIYIPFMIRNGYMDGGQFVPLSIIEGEEFTRETNRMRIKCIKKKSMFSRYSLEDMAQYLVNLPPPEQAP